MKKKISLLGLVLILVLGFTGCSKSETIEYDQTTLEQYADFIIQNSSMMSDEDMEYFQDMSELQLDMLLLDSGVPVTGENFLDMMDAWNSGEEDCGAFVSCGDYEMEVTNDGPVLTTKIEFEDRNGTAEFVFDEKMNMKSLTVSAEYSIGEILQKAALNTILGMGTVFVVLIFLSFVIWLLKFIPVIQEKFRKGSKTEETQTLKAAPAPAPAAEADVTLDTELAAVIAAAIAASESTSPDGFVVRSIRRRKSNKWN